jgi:RHS repeat-associated protein
VVNLTNSEGVKITDYSYKAFGELRSQFSPGFAPNQWLFTGRQFDQESGLYNYRNRYYDPRIGRFSSQDPSLTLNPHSRVIPYLLLNQLPNPLQLHRYLYCINNPVNLRDPFGLNPWQGVQDILDRFYNWYQNYQQEFGEWFYKYTHPQPIIQIPSFADRLYMELSHSAREYGPWVVWWAGRVYYNFKGPIPPELYPPPPGWKPQDWYNFEDPQI